MSISLLVLEFIIKEFDQKSGNRKDPHLNFVQYLETGVSKR